MSKGLYSADRVRKSFVHFLLGRGVTSIASLLVAFVVVRHLSVPDYAAYTAISGLLVVFMMISGGGLERVVPRYIPELYQHGSVHSLKAFCWKLVVLRLLFLAPVLILAAVFYQYLAAWFELPEERAVFIALAAYITSYALTMHMTRTLQALLLQRQATTGMAIEWISKLIALVATLALINELSLVEVLAIQAATGLLSLLYMLVVLATFLARQVDHDRMAELDLSQVFRMGLHNYLHGITGLHAGQAVSKIVCAYFMPASVTAAFGFAHAITGALKRYLPANLLLGLIEPVVMARYSEERDFSKTVHLVTIVLKVNLFLLVPLTIWFYFAGEPIVLLLTGGKYPDSVAMICALMVFLMMESHRLVLQMIANAVETSEWLLHSNLWSMILVPFILVAIYFGGIRELIAGMLLLSTFRNSYIVWRLNRHGLKYQLDIVAVCKLILVSLACTYIGTQLAATFSSGLLFCIGSGLLSGTLYVVVTFFWKVFSQAERDTLNNFLGRRLFVW